LYRFIFLAAAVQSITLGQSISLSIGSASGTPGGSVPIAINLTSIGGAQPAGLQWSFAFSSDITGVTVVTGSAATAAQKSLSCSANTCLIFGLNTSVIENGTVAVATFQIAPNASATTIPIQITGVVASTIEGSSISASGGSGAVSLSGPAPDAARLASLSCAPSTLGSNATSTCTVSLNKAAGSTTTVSINSGNAVVTAPASVTVAASQSSATFTVSSGTVSNAQNASIAATLDGASQTATLTLTPLLTVLVSSLNCGPATVNAPGTSACTVTLASAAPSGGLTVSLASSNPSVTIPASLNLSQGQSTTGFTATVASVGSDQTAVLTATLSSSTQTFTLTASAPSTPATLSGLSCAPSTLGSNATSTCTVSLSKAAVVNASVFLTSNAAITVPASVTVGANQSSATFTASSGTVSSAQNVTVTATLSASRRTATLTLTPTAVTSGKPQVLGIFNAASFAPELTCIPGSFASLMGAGFAPNGFWQVAAGDTLPNNLTGLEVRINDAAVPMLFASDTLINFQCPNLPLSTELTITVKPASGPESDPIKALVGEASPGIFLLFGSAQGAVLIAATGQIAMPTIEGLPTRPARAGEFLSIYASGIGPLEESLPAGAPAPIDHLVRTTDPVTVVVGGVEVTPSFSGLAPGQVGLNQVNFKLPDDVASGDAVELYVRVVSAAGSVLRSNAVTIAVQDKSSVTGTVITGTIKSEN